MARVSDTPKDRYGRVISVRLSRDDWKAYRYLEDRLAVRDTIPVRHKISRVIRYCLWYAAKGEGYNENRREKSDT